MDPNDPYARFKVGSANVNTFFDPKFARAFRDAIHDMNKRGIVPVITSGYRTSADQKRMQAGGSGSNPAAKLSFHQAGAAVDIGPGSNKRNFEAIKEIMKNHGFMWGGDFRRNDPPHFEINFFGIKGTPEYHRNLRGAADSDSRWFNLHQIHVSPKKQQE